MQIIVLFNDITSYRRNDKLFPLIVAVLAESTTSTSMMTDAGKDESWGAVQEQIRKENLQNDVEMSWEEDEQEDVIVYSPIRIYVNEEASDDDDADECHTFNARTEGSHATLKASLFYSNSPLKV